MSHTQYQRGAVLRGRKSSGAAKDARVDVQEDPSVSAPALYSLLQVLVVESKKIRMLLERHVGVTINDEEVS